MTRTVTIIGLGLIGGAVGIALRHAGWRVLYVDPQVSEDEAQRAGAADARAESIDGGNTDVIVVATPVDVAIDLVRTIESESGVVTSVCSVMQPLRVVARRNFVAGHPMTGWHEGGLANAHHVSFDGASWFLDAADERVEQLVRDCGATPVPIDAREHDAAVALTSHLPQVLSTALFAYLSEQPDVTRFAGSGLRSFRLAASDGALWHSILEVNRENLRPHAAAIAQLVQAILEGDDPQAFARAQEMWRRLSS
jgi:prephenate dehydrogenase